MLKFGIQPFWFWNGNMRDEEIARQISEMAQQGINGFFIHPRQGLTVPYLSEEWFRKVRIAVDEAKKFKLEVWLYDEYPYPSGVSGGQVISDHPEFEAKSLQRQTIETSGYQNVELDLPWGQIMHAYAYPFKDCRIVWEKKINLASYIGTGYKENIFQLSGLTHYNKKRYFTGVPIKKLYWKVPEGEWHIEIITQTTVEHFKYFGKYIDPLNPDAITYYIKTTHEKYREHLSDEFGKTIKGIFTDEITAFPNDLPWSPTLPEQFLRRNGYSLNDNLPALYVHMTEKTNKVRYDYWNTVTELFIQNYEIPVHEWCKKNDLLYVGEKPILRSKQLKYFDVPGIDTGHQKAGSVPCIADSNYRANGKIVASAAHFYDKPAALCECFHSIGWGMTMQDMKWIFDWLAIQGISWFVPHAFFYTTDALTKHDAPPSLFYQAPYWGNTSLLAEYADKITEVMNGSKRKVNILLLDSVTSQWTSMGEKQEVRKRLKEDSSSLQKTLLSHHLDYYIIDPDLLEQCEIEDQCIQLKGEKFSLLILPPMLNIENYAFEKIKEYIERGGNIIGTLCLPIEQIDNVSNLEDAFSGLFGIDAGEAYKVYIRGYENSDKSLTIDNFEQGGCYFASSIEILPKIVEKLIPKDISVKLSGEVGQESNILSAIYERESKTYCFLINISGYDHNVNISIRSGSLLPYKLTQIPLGLGEDEWIFYKQEGEVISFPLEFCPYQSYLLVLERNLEGQHEQTVMLSNRMALDLSGIWEISVDRMNSLRLGTWNFSLLGNSMEGLVECQPIINQISELGFPLPVNLKEHFGCPKEIAFPSLKCSYRTTFHLDAVAVNTPVFLVLEPGSIEGEWHIEVNGYRINQEDLQNREIFLPTNLATEISSCLKPGINEIFVRVNTHHVHDGLLNPIYLCGNFSVHKDAGVNNWRIASFQKAGKIGEMSTNGLPFYAGVIRYKKMFKLNTDSIENVLELSIKDTFFQDVLEMFVNGHSAGIRAWLPYNYRVYKSCLKPGMNEIELRVSTTLLGLFEGQYFDYHEHRYIEV